MKHKSLKTWVLDERGAPCSPTAIFYNATYSNVLKSNCSVVQPTEVGVQSMFSKTFTSKTNCFVVQLGVEL